MKGSSSTKTGKDREEKHFTYKEYSTWPENERWELIDGEAFDMTPAPNVNHQRVQLSLGRIFQDFLDDKECEAFIAPIDVRIPRKKEADEKIETIVQPDIIIVCDKEKLDEKGCRGAPDLVVEILSPRTASRDCLKKLRLYEKCGVKEYWIVSPENREVTVLTRKSDNTFGSGKEYKEGQKVPVSLFPGFHIEVKKIFARMSRSG